MVCWVGWEATYSLGLNEGLSYSTRWLGYEDFEQNLFNSVCMTSGDVVLMVMIYETSNFVVGCICNKNLPPVLTNLSSVFLGVL